MLVPRVLAAFSALRSCRPEGAAHVLPFWVFCPFPDVSSESPCLCTAPRHPQEPGCAGALSCRFASPKPTGSRGDEEVPAPCQPVLTQRHREPRSPPPASRLPYSVCYQLLASPARIFGFSLGGFHPQHPQRHGTGGGLLVVEWPEPSEHQGLLRPCVPRCSETCWALQVNAKP